MSEGVEHLSVLSVRAGAVNVEREPAPTRFSHSSTAAKAAKGSIITLNSGLCG